MQAGIQRGVVIEHFTDPAESPALVFLHVLAAIEQVACSLWRLEFEMVDHFRFAAGLIDAQIVETTLAIVNSKALGSAAFPLREFDAARRGGLVLRAVDEFVQIGYR